jgi:ATP-binding cassette, sub-family E, member 1
MLTEDNYIIAVEHDLSIIDYLSDSICLSYGYPGVYGVFSDRYPVRDGINYFLEGFIPNDNLTFRKTKLTFGNSECKKGEEKISSEVIPPKSYPAMTKKFDTFKISIQPG